MKATSFEAASGSSTSGGDAARIRQTASWWQRCGLIGCDSEQRAFDLRLDRWARTRARIHAMQRARIALTGRRKKTGTSNRSPFAPLPRYISPARRRPTTLLSPRFGRPGWRGSSTAAALRVSAVRSDHKRKQYRRAAFPFPPPEKRLSLPPAPSRPRSLARRARPLNLSFIPPADRARLAVRPAPASPPLKENPYRTALRAFTAIRERKKSIRQPSRPRACPTERHYNVQLPHPPIRHSQISERRVRGGHHQHRGRSSSPHPPSLRLS